MSDLFEEKSKEWDQNQMILALSSNIGAAIVQSVELGAHMRVLDFGAGTGLIASHLAPHVDSIVAVDISEAMLEKLAAKPELQGRVEPLCHDILADRLDEQFDLIVSAMAMHHVENTDLLFSTFAEHLKPGAKVALADLDQEDGTFHPPNTEGVYHAGFDRDDLKSVMHRHGFEQIDFQTAHVVSKENGDFPVFLVTATKV